MKKFTFFIAAVLMTSLAFGQTAKTNLKTVVSKDGTTITRPVEKRLASQTKTVYISENFDIDPLEWDQQNTHATQEWFAGNPTGTPFTTVDPTNVSSALFSYIGEDCDEIIYSPVFDATGSTNLQLSFYCGYSGPWMIGGSQAAGLGADVRAVISTDGGANWTQLWSYADTHGGTEGWAWELVEIDLQATYGGNSNLIVGFQYFGNDGDLAGIDGVLIEDYTAPTDPDLSVVAIAQQAMTPLAHATYELGATVKNNGADLVADETLNISVTPGTYTDAMTITVPFAAGEEATFTSSNLFVADVIGTHTATFVATLADDPTPENNTSSTSFDVTELTFGTDNGTILGGGGSNTGPITFGNIYMLMSEDIISSFTIGWGVFTDNQDFTVSIYSINPSTLAATEVYTSENLTKTVDMSEAYAEFDIVNQTLPAGLYLFAVNQLDATNIGVGYDEDASGMIYIWDGTDLVQTSALGNIAVRVNVAAEGPHAISYLPENNATDVAIDAIVSATFDVNITEVDFTGITITPDPGNLTASIVDDVLTIAHDDFDFNTTYTALIPTGAISDGTDNLGYDVQWSFTTGLDPAACNDPSNIIISDITEFGATVTWTENGAGTEWFVNYGPEGFDPEALGTTVTADATTIDLTGLTHNTTYEVYVQANCDPETSGWVGPVQFTTLYDCSDATITSLPYTTNFDTEEPCWVIEQNNANVTWEWETGEYTCHYDDALGLQDEWLITPKFDLSTVTDNIAVSFTWLASYYYSVDPQDNYDLFLKVSTNGTDWVTLWDETDEGVFENWTEYTTTVSANAYTGEASVWFAFNYYGSDGAQWSVFDFTVDVVSKSEINLESNISVYPNPANSIITIANAENENIMVLNMLGEVVANISNATSNQTIDISNLSNGTYFVKVNSEVFKINLIK